MKTPSMANPLNFRSRTRGGITLIELLVALEIIALHGSNY